MSGTKGHFIDYQEPQMWSYWSVLENLKIPKWSPENFCMTNRESGSRWFDDWKPQLTIPCLLCFWHVRFLRQWVILKVAVSQHRIASAPYDSGEEWRCTVKTHRADWVRLYHQLQDKFGQTHTWIFWTNNLEKSPRVDMDSKSATLCDQYSTSLDQL